MSAAEEILALLRAEESARNVEGMARFGIQAKKAYGVSVTRLRKIAKPYGRDRKLAAALWKEGSIEAKILASLVDDPATLTEAAAERYLRGFENWAVTDAFCLNLFDRAAWAYEKPALWSAREDEQQKRAAFALMAGLAWHDKASKDARFAPFFALCEREAGDPRNYVKKSVSWALRQMGKRTPALRKRALASAAKLAAREELSARWIARDVAKELSAH